MPPAARLHSSRLPISPRSLAVPLPSAADCSSALSKPTEERSRRCRHLREVLEFIFSKEFDYEDIDNLLSDNLNQWFLLVTQNSVEEIDISYSIDIELLTLNPEDFVLMEELSSVARTLKMLHTLKFIHFNGSRSEMQSIKVLLACFPGIKKVVIVRGWIRSGEEFKIMQEFLRFPRASTKAEIFYI
nr:F-box/FBD/LRR-repeat protein At1g13570-like isoform X1 [Ipomoea batatas]